ncbi:Protein of unknown function [Bosea sp. CRIB-10]|uniref:DUF3987 domain-containing protein n=1 Tax=Bosea sp. CRIB-10 TaxID=378404 RepID=UPI0008ED0655|nr:DUF3987 domain-containing protein [Bosea sp. CRIB-10]SFD51455.1 Protein of unknown function [Bosea sp. CRIB-10]
MADEVKDGPSVNVPDASAGIAAPMRPPVPIRRPIVPAAVPQQIETQVRHGADFDSGSFDPAQLDDSALAAEITMLAEGYNVAPTMPLLSLLVSASTALGSQVQVRIGAVWHEPPILWGMIVAPPGSRKSAMVALPKSLLGAVAAAEQEEWRLRHEIAARERRQLELEWAVHDAERRKAIRDHLDDPAPPARRPDAVVVPIRPGIVVEDSSIEEMTERAAGSPRGILALSDEASAMLARGRSTRALMLQATSAGSLRVGRISRESRQLGVFAISVLSATQPDRVGAFLGGEDDGLAGRFLWVWVGEALPPRIAMSQLALDGMLDMMARLREMGRVNSMTAIPVSADGIQLLQQAMQRWHGEANRHGGLVRSWFEKAPGHAGRLALVLEAMLAARSSGELPDGISASRIGVAIALIDRVFAPAMMTVAGHVGQGRRERMSQALVDHLVSNELDAFRLRDLRREHAGRFGDARLLQEAIRELEADGTLVRADRQPGARGRRPGDYVVDRSLLGTAQRG